MEFCEICGKPLIIQEKKSKCSCGFEKELKENSLVAESEAEFKKVYKGKGYVDGGNELATFEHECKKCGYGKAQIIDLEVWIGDEAGVIRYRCGKCGFTEQDKGSNT